VRGINAIKPKRLYFVHSMFGGEFDESDDEDFSGDNGWIAWFCGLKGHEFVVEVEEEYIKDNFNLYGLRGQIQYYDQALEMILSCEAPDEEDLADSEFLEIYRDATELYGFIHARYIVSPRGLQVMKEKYSKAAFGTCPRVLCERQHVLPIGIVPEQGTTDVSGQTLKIFCPKCEQVYTPKSKHKDIDGSFFGMSFPQIFLQTYPLQQPLEPPCAYVPRVFGFKLHGVKSLISRKNEEDEAAVRALEDRERAGRSSASAGGAEG
jgi:casein kinase II subunit beta